LYRVSGELRGLAPIHEPSGDARGLADREPGWGRDQQRRTGERPGVGESPAVGRRRERANCAGRSAPQTPIRRRVSWPSSPRSSSSVSSSMASACAPSADSRRHGPRDPGSAVIRGPDSVIAGLTARFVCGRSTPTSARGPRAQRKTAQLVRRILNIIEVFEGLCVVVATLGSRPKSTIQGRGQPEHLLHARGRSGPPSLSGAVASIASGGTAGGPTSWRVTSAWPRPLRGRSLVQGVLPDRLSDRPLTHPGQFKGAARTNL